MVTKFVRKDFREHAKGSHREVTTVQPPMTPFPKARWKRVQIFSLLAIICILFILDGLQHRREALREEISRSDGVVVDKYQEILEDGKRYTVELELPLEDDEAANVAAVCSEALWNTLEIGAHVEVKYFTKFRDGQLVIRSITPVEAASDREDASE